MVVGGMTYTRSVSLSHLCAECLHDAEAAEELQCAERRSALRAVAAAFADPAERLLRLLAFCVRRDSDAGADGWEIPDEDLVAELCPGVWRARYVHRVGERTPWDSVQLARWFGREMASRGWAAPDTLRLRWPETVGPFRRTTWRSSAEVGWRLAGASNHVHVRDTACGPVTYHVDAFVTPDGRVLLDCAEPLCDDPPGVLRLHGLVQLIELLVLTTSGGSPGQPGRSPGPPGRAHGPCGPGSVG